MKSNEITYLKNMLASLKDINNSFYLENETHTTKRVEELQKTDKTIQGLINDIETELKHFKYHTIEADAVIK